MLIALTLLCLQTIALWSLVFFFHRQKQRFTLVPLYCFIAVLTLLTHNLSDLGFAVIVQNWFFLISSFSYFTSLMLGVLLLYLFEGPRATRLALMIVLFTSFFYVAVVYLLGLLTDTTKWIALTPKQFLYYFWSFSAIVVDIFFITIVWEVMGKIEKIPLIVRVFLIVFGVYVLDSVIFVTGVYGGQSMYFSVLQGSLSVRFILALFATPLVSFYLNSEGYAEKNRAKPKTVWEILNFRSDLEVQISSMEEMMKREKELEKQIKESQETYALAVEGANAGIWDWDILKDKITYSSKFLALLGYGENEIGATVDDFKKIIYHEDIKNTFDTLDIAFKAHSPFSVEYRLKTKSGKFKWFQCGGVVRYNTERKPVRMVGSIIDIDEKKQLLVSHDKQVQELEEINKAMVGRELEMIELKKKIATLDK